MLRTDKKILPKIIAVVIAMLLLVFLGKKGFFNPVKHVFGYIITGGSYEVRSGVINSRNLTEALFNLSKVVEENEGVKKIELENKIAQKNILELQEENNLLRKQLELLPKSDYELISAEVIFQDPHSADRIIVINKGSSNGIKEGMPVIIYDRILVGNVCEVESKRSRVILSVSSQNTFDAKLAGKQIVGIAQGRYNLEIVLGLIPNSANLEKGQLIVTSGKSSKFPPGLLVGEIVSTSQSLDGLFKQAVVKPFYSASDLKFVFLIKE